MTIDPALLAVYLQRCAPGKYYSNGRGIIQRVGHANEHYITVQCAEAEIVTTEGIASAIVYALNHRPTLCFERQPGEMKSAEELKA